MILRCLIERFRAAMFKAPLRMAHTQRGASRGGKWRGELHTKLNLGLDIETPWRRVKGDIQ